MGKMTYNHFQPAISRWDNVQTMCHGIFTAGRRTVTGLQGWSRRGWALNERRLFETGLACSALMTAPPGPPHVNWQELDAALVLFSCGNVFICIPPPSSNVHSRQEVGAKLLGARGQLTGPGYRNKNQDKGGGGGGGGVIIPFQAAVVCIVWVRSPTAYVMRGRR